ncbi:hypothetical protein HPP92_014526 [Vanilla planifolia]|uniref:Uncharacterized protein n=1 Tax=Vanilla planifolia TaxID=51239 RepID=A0A835QR44_VANPL|nr:hypothetical protein HPP92_014526 [Vanilla planifolia]
METEMESPGAGVALPSPSAPHRRICHRTSLSLDVVTCDIQGADGARRDGVSASAAARAAAALLRGEVGVGGWEVGVPAGASDSTGRGHAVAGGGSCGSAAALGVVSIVFPLVLVSAAVAEALEMYR